MQWLELRELLFTVFLLQVNPPVAARNAELASDENKDNCSPEFSFRNTYPAKLSFIFRNVQCLAGVESICFQTGMRHDPDPTGECIEVPPQSKIRGWPYYEVSLEQALNPGPRWHTVLTFSSGLAVSSWNFDYDYRPAEKTTYEYHSGDNLSSEARAALFDDVYRLNIWQDNRLGMTACPSSGCGSAPEATGLAREALVEAIKVFAVRSISELGCGDHTWLGEVKLESMGCSYVGTDISRVVVEANRLKYPHRNFSVADAVVDPPPPADLILFRHVLMHLSAADNARVLRNVQHSGGRFFMASIHLDRNPPKQRARSEPEERHSLIAGGTKRLFEPPFCLQVPLRMYRDDFPSDNRAISAQQEASDTPLGMLALWRLDEGLFREGPGCTQGL
mmetsp:Transcript_34908/g.78879  ORF Transcript_34908/g.78879 Transcript_34908/m.78879 type:complete len:392 (+) Transcript_34908:93-1268(+)